MPTAAPNIARRVANEPADPSGHQEAPTVSTETEPTGNVTFSAENFGPIAKAEFDLRPLTVFVGPSNTGKSYLAMLVYALCEHCRANRGILRAPDPQERGAYDRLSEEEKEAFSVWEENYQTARLETPDAVPALPGPVVGAIRRFFAGPGDSDEEVAGALRRHFGLSHTKRLVREQSTCPARVGIFVPGVSARVGIDIEPGTGSVSVSGGISPSFEFRPKPLVALDRSSLVRLPGAKGERHPEPVRRLLYALLCWSAFSDVFRPLLRPSHYLPADRTGIMDAFNVLSRALMRRGADAVAEPSPDVPGLLPVLADFLDKLVKPAEADGSLAEFSKELEDDILKGAIREERAGGTNFPVFSYVPGGRGNGGEIPLASASSAVSELAPVVLFLRNVVQVGDLLIIEEPESHLHPAMQSRLAVQLAKLVRAGLRVVVTTHSECILEQFANLVGASALDGRAKARFEDRHPYLAGVCIPSEKVGVWLFSSGKESGSTVSEIRLDMESGVFPAEFDDVGVGIYSDWAEIYNELQEARGDGGG